MHEEPAVALAALVVCWPLGLVLTWSNARIDTSTKLLITVLWFGLMVGAATYRFLVP